MKNLILSSTSPARKALLERLSLPFEVIAPNIDETRLPSESAQELVKRLAIEKAKVHSAQFPNSLIIGSDQVAVIENEVIGKPLTHENALKMLLSVSGKTINFFTGLCLYNTETDHCQAIVEKNQVVYRYLTREKIENYLNKEKPYQCAGSIKVEGLGIALMQELIGTDPSTLTGLPLIRLVDMLEKEGINIV